MLRSILGINLAQNSESSLQAQIQNIVVAVGLFIFQSVQIFSLCSFGLIFALINKIKLLLTPTVYETEFDAFINTKKGKEIFKKYAKKEWSLENILFYEDVQKYKNITSFKYAQRRSKEICNNFINPGSPLEINLSSHVRRSTQEKVKNIIEYKDGFKIIFDDSIKETKRNMRDTFARILKEEDYKIWKMSSRNIIEENPDTVN